MNLSPRPARWLYLTAFLVFLADQLSKSYAEHRLAGSPPLVLVPGVLQLSYTTNTGGAFGLLSRFPWVFAAATVLVAGMIVWQSSKVHRVSAAIALGLLLGGALGNLADRLAGGWSFDGTVTDFIDLRVWPVFNVADSAIVIGALILVVVNLRSQRAGVAADSVSGVPTSTADDAPRAREDGTDG